MRSDAPPPVLSDGYTDLPAGKVAAVVTYLEIHDPPPGARASAHASAGRLDAIAGDLARYLALYRRIGEPWLWFSRLVMSEASLRTILDDPRVKAFALHEDGRDLGLLELDFRQPGECELSFFGVVPEAIGRGFGGILMAEALRRAWEAPIKRLWVHTCTLDHPRALGFYMHSGFQPYKRAVEIADDPRLKGYLPPAAAPHMPPLPGHDVRSRLRSALPRWAGRGRSRGQ
jgi:GNAT superfamily N-acetyltransferase